MGALSIRNIGSNTSVSPFAVWLVAAALYALPDGYLPTAPDAPHQARIERALGELRGHDLQKRERAVRDLALIGEPALPAIVARLNSAGSSERALLLTAVARLSAARSLMDQALRDPDPAVRAVASPPQREPEGLARLAARYIDIVALTRDINRKEFTGHFRGLKPKLARSESQYELLRERMGDESMDSAMQYEYRMLSVRFARAADAALRAGKLKPELYDPIFVAFLGLLYDEDVAALNAARTLVALGENAAPALVGMLNRKGHDPRTILRILVAGGQGELAMARNATQWPDLRFAQIEMAPRALPREKATEFLVKAMQDDEARHRRMAMEGLLGLGNVSHERLRAPYADFGDDEWVLAIRLRRAGGDADILRQSLQAEKAQLRAARRVLRTLSVVDRRPILDWMLSEDSAALRWLAVDYLTDVKTLVGLAQTAKDEKLRVSAARRAIELGSTEGLSFVAKPDRRLVRTLREHGFIDEVVALALGDDETVVRLALNELRFAERIDPKHEKDLIALYARLSEPRKWDALDALVPLGTPAVVQVLEEAGNRALGSLGVRVDDGQRIPFDFPLERFVGQADATELQRLSRLGAAMAKLDPGFYLAIFEKWGTVDATEADVEGGSSGQKIETVRHLVRAADPASVRELFARVVSGKITAENLVMPIFQAAARQLPPEELAVIAPKLLEKVKLDYPDARGMPPEPNPPRNYFIWFGMRALAYRQVDAGLEPIVRILLDPNLQRERYDEQAGRRLPYDWTRQAREALRHYSPSKVAAAMRKVMGEMEQAGELAELNPVHLFRLLAAWRSHPDRGRRLHAFALELCDLLDRLPFEGETGVARMLAVGAQARYAEAAAIGRATAERKRARGFDPADDLWSPRRIEGRATIYAALGRGKIPECVPQLRKDPYLLWIAGIYLRFIVGDAKAAEAPSNESWRCSAWLDRDVRNLCADLLTVAGDGAKARELMQPNVLPPLRIRQGEGWYHFYLARALAGAGQATRARGELADALRINRRLLSSTKADPSLKGFAEVFRQADEDYFDWLFSD